MAREEPSWQNRRSIFFGYTTAGIGASNWRWTHQKVSEAGEYFSHDYDQIPSEGGHPFKMTWLLISLRINFRIFTSSKQSSRKRKRRVCVCVRWCLWGCTVCAWLCKCAYVNLWMLKWHIQGVTKHILLILKSHWHSVQLHSVYVSPVMTTNGCHFFVQFWFYFSIFLLEYMVSTGGQFLEPVHRQPATWTLYRWGKVLQSFLSNILVSTSSFFERAVGVFSESESWHRRGLALKRGH